jgi:hypothetical protein
MAISALPFFILLLCLIIALPFSPALAQEESTGTYYTIQYAPDGTELWQTIYDSGKWDYGYAVAADSEGNVIVTGASERLHDYDANGEEDTGELNYDCFTIKYDSEGNEVWEQPLIYDSGAKDEVYGITVDSGNNIIVVGRAADDYLIIKYAPDGTELWPEPLIHDGGDIDGANSVVVDSGGNIIVTGFSTIWHDYNGDEVEDAEEKNLDFYTIKYDPNGNELWSKTYDQGLDDGSLEVALDSADNIIVTGAAELVHDYNNNGIEDEEDVNSDYCTIKYDPGGNELWDAPLFYDSERTDTAYGAAVDSQDNIIITGSYSIQPESEPGAITLPLFHTYTTRKYEPDGTIIWTEVYDTVDYQEVAYDVAVDSEDNIIVTGKVTDGATWNYFTIKYDEDRNELWSRTYDGGEWDSALDVVIGPGNDVIITGSSKRFLDSDGGPPTDGGGGLHPGVITGIVIGGFAAIGFAYYMVNGSRTVTVPRAERRRKAAKQRKKAKR